MDDINNFIEDIENTKLYDAKQVDFANEAIEKAFDSAERMKGRNSELSGEALELLSQHFSKLLSMNDKEIVENKEQLIPKDERFWKLFEQFQHPTFKSSKIDPNDLPREHASAPFFFMDIMQPTSDGNAIALTTSFPGFPHGLCRPIIWSDVLKPLIEWVLKVKHSGRFGTSAATAIRRLFGSRHIDIGDDTVNHFSLFVKNLANRYWKFFKYKFLPFRDATEFYSESDPIYGKPIDTKDIVFVFSTTSGLLIPEEHYGRNVPHRLSWLKETTAAKNPARLGYFAQGILSSKRTIPVCYAWDMNKTKQTLRNNYQKASDTKNKNIYRKESERILTKAMGSRNLQIVQMHFEKIGEWYVDPRAYLTLTSKRYAIWSWRPPQKNDVHIGHGLKIDGESFGKILKLESVAAGLASLSANNFLLSAILATLPFVPEKIIAEPIAKTVRTLQHTVVKSLFDNCTQRQVIKDIKPFGRRKASERSCELVNDYLCGLDSC